MGDSQIQLSTNVGTGKTLATYNDGADDHQKALLEFLVGTTPTKVTSAAPLPVTLADGGSVTLGAKADAKNAATDTTAITAMSVWKQLSDYDKAMSRIVVVTSTQMIRPADTAVYAALDAVANSTTAGSVTTGKLSFTVSDTNDAPVSLRQLTIVTNETGISGVAFRAYFFQEAPTVVSGDNAAFSVAPAAWIGSMVGTFRSSTFTGGNAAILLPEDGPEIPTLPSSGAKTVFALLQTLGVYTPASGKTYDFFLKAAQGRP